MKAGTVRGVFFSLGLIAIVLCVFAWIALDEKDHTPRPHLDEYLLLASLCLAFLITAVGVLLARYMDRLADVKQYARRLEVESEQVRRAESRTRRLFDKSPIPMWIYEVDTFLIVDVNETAIEHYGYPREEFVGKDIRTLRPKRDIETLSAAVARVTPEYREQGTWRHVKADGSTIYVDIASYCYDEDGHTYELIIATDVTDRIQAQIELASSESALRAVFDKAPLGLFYSYLHENRFERANQVLLSMLGYSSQRELLQIELSENLYFNPGDRQRILDKVLETGRIDRVESVFKTKSGQPLHVRMTVRLMNLEDDKPGLLGYVEDLSKAAPPKDEIRQP